MVKKTWTTPYPEDTFLLGFSSQQEWRWLIAAAFYFGAVGGGLFIISVYLNFVLGMVVGYFIVAVLKNLAHFLYLGHPFRFYWAFTQPHRSWISRGLISVFTFTVFGGLYLISLFPLFSWLPWAEGEGLIAQTFKIIAVVAALVVMIYTAFVMAYPPSIPFWNNSILPVLFFSLGLGGGVSLILLLHPFLTGGEVDVHFVELLGEVLIVANFCLVVFYLLAVHNGPVGAQESVRVLLYKGGGLSVVFNGVVLGLGLIIPMGIVIYSHVAQLKGIALTSLLASGAVLELAGGFFLRFCILRAGVYNPLL